MTSIFLIIFSGKLDIVKVLHKTQIRDKLEAIWLFLSQAILWVPVKSIGEEIKTHQVFCSQSRDFPKQIVNETYILQWSN